MSQKEESLVVSVGMGEVAVITMVNGTTDSNFVLMYGVPLTDRALVDEYAWADVHRNGKVVELRAELDNPMVIDGNKYPGTYKLRNNGTDDEQALIHVNTFKPKVGTI